MSAPTPATETLSRSSKLIRLAITAVALGLLLAGTLIGQDDAFPFGPFRMYSTTDKLDAPVKSTRMEAVDTSGRRFALAGESVGLRRAEIEGQLGRFQSQPELLENLAIAYDNRNPDAPPLARIEIITRHFELDGGQPTGDYTDQVNVAWTPAGGAK